MIHDTLPLSNSDPTASPGSVAESRIETFKPRKRGLAHIIRDVADQLPPVFTAAELFTLLAEQQLCGADDLQKVKWALKYLGGTGQVNIAEPGSPGQFGRVPRYTFGAAPEAAPERDG